MGVIRLGNKGKDQQLRSKTPYACVALFAQSLGGHHHIQKYNHVKAHRSGEEYAGLSEVQRRFTDANIKSILARTI